MKITFFSYTSFYHILRQHSCLNSNSKQLRNFIPEQCHFISFFISKVVLFLSFSTIHLSSGGPRIFGLWGRNFFTNTRGSGAGAPEAIFWVSFTCFTIFNPKNPMINFHSFLTLRNINQHLLTTTTN